MTDQRPEPDPIDEEVPIEDVVSDEHVGKDAARQDGKQHPPTDPDLSDGGPASPAFLIGLAKWHPFTAYLMFLADCRYPATMAPHERFRATEGEHPRLARWARIFDFALIIVILFFLAAVACLIVYNSLWPCR